MSFFNKTARIFYTIPLFIFTNPAWAGCNDLQTHFMSCTFANGKMVETCTDGSVVDYVFGYPGKTPELSISLAFQEGAEMVPWPGVGSTIWEAIRLTNNDIIYEVYGGFDRPQMTDEEADAVLPERFGGIRIEDMDGTELAHLECLPGTVEYGF